MPETISEYEQQRLDNIARNQLRLALHLNVAACGLRAADVFGATRYDDTIAHCTRVLEVDPTNLKALFRRGQAHLAGGRLSPLQTS